MFLTLFWFSACLSLETVPPDAARRAASEILEWLNERSHLRHPCVRWDIDRRVLIVTMEAEFFDAEQAGDALAEELQEVAMAILDDYESARVDIVQVDALAG